ncbi:PAS domain S-box-containing protein/diguanylate cyclase (GGDEF) domain-containing protein [Paraburkholderia fungorum]|uniref:PAS domain S-box-containing protein/diguanylate cyclase (GGDEF) domain-containing protein n=1 Tax=Paraburkholderia fungorum TaxID=134537 RepID=A0A1H1JDI8_9BURK|nr:EAL domain-containing protein [Paraburkholderia fungorum]SDR47518.1 PAS domain S-box-containing protein/diguanylate cyclase (GGDEF) domain-containing protein [Paraburkholderia fungorum]
MNWARLVLLPLVVLSAALSVTWMLWDHERQASRHELQNQFNFSLGDAVSRIEQRMGTYELLLRGVQSFVVAGGDVDRERFRAYVDTLNVDANFSGIQAIGIVAWVPAAQKTAHVAAMHRQGLLDYAIQSQGSHDNYAPIIQREPFVGINRAPPGFDAWSDPVRRRALEQARDSGMATVSGKVHLSVDARTNAHPGFIMYLPLYAPGQPQNSVEQRRAHLIGWVYASFRMRDVIASLYGEQPPGLSIAVYDGVTPSPAALFHRTPDAPGLHRPSDISASEYLVVGGHNWTLSMSAQDDFYARFGRNAMLPIAVTGTGLSLLLALLTWLMMTSRGRTLRLASAMTKELRENEEKFRAIADCTVNWEIWWGRDGKPRWINPAVKDYIGYTVDECMSMRDFAGAVIYPEDIPRVAPEFRKALKGGRGDDLEFRCIRKDGSLMWLSASWVPISDSTGGFIGFRTSGRDITERKQAEAELRIAAVAFDSMEPMMITDASATILRVNSAFTECTGYAPEEIVGQTPRALRSNRHAAAFFEEMWDTIRRVGGWQGEIWGRRKNGDEYPKWLTISAVVSDDGVVSHYVGTHHDITQRKIAEERIRELAFFDALTRLPNRTLLLDRLKQAIAGSAQTGECGALLFIDLDRFKTLNDTLGHDKGDLLLKHVAQRLAASVRDSDTVARVGGDEFVVVLRNLHRNRREAAAQTEALCEKLLATLGTPYQLGDVQYRSGASIGATVFNGHRTLIDELLKQADLAMYKSKERGRNAMCFFDPEMQTIVVERALLEAGLRDAVEGNQLLLQYQAQVNHNDITGVEALVSWQHPRRGLISPSDFIPLAEETGLIFALGNWVLETACAQLAQWATRADMEHLTIAVNVSAQQFRESDFVEKVLTIIDRTGARPDRLQLELTESVLVDNVQDIIRKMEALKEKGIVFALDDFGIGYSSLSYLKRLPLDQLKIDRSFVRDILVDPNDAVIASAIVALARSLGLGVIAEGVETEAQRDFLAAAGCHAYQGYFFSRPLSIEDFEAMFRQTQCPSVDSRISA